jgi:uncharacterized iron-regulated membrane protein
MRNSPGTAILALINGFIAFILLGLLIWWGRERMAAAVGLGLHEDDIVAPTLS